MSKLNPRNKEIDAPDRQRRVKGTAVKRLCVDLSLTAYEALLELAGERSYGLTLDRLIAKAKAAQSAHNNDSSITN